MKRLSLLILALSIALSGCNLILPAKVAEESSTEIPSVNTSSEKDSLSSQDSVQTEGVGNTSLDQNAQKIIATLNTFLTSQGEDISVLDFGQGFQHETFGEAGYNIYRTSGIMGYNSIVVEHIDDGSLLLLDLENYSNYPIKSISPVYEQEENLTIFCESSYFGGDYIFVNFPSQITYSLADNKISSLEYFPESGSYGMVGTFDWQSFGDVRILDENTACFEFLFRDGGNGNGYAGPEIVIDIPYPFEEDQSMSLLFKNTENNLADSFLEEFRKIEGIASVEASLVENNIISGTQLKVTPEKDYSVVPSFNKYEQDTLLKDFSLSVEKSQPLE